MINAKKARELAMKAKAQKAEIANIYFYNEFKRFDKQIEEAASIHGKTHILLKFTPNDSFDDISPAERKKLIQNYYEKEGFTVAFNPRVRHHFTLSW
jgi:hypothetical protein